MPSSLVLKRLEEADWRHIFPALVSYAESRTRQLPFVKGGGPLPQGQTPEDIVVDAVRSVFEGERAWNPNTQPDLLRHLQGVVRSKVSNLVTSADHKRRAGGQADEKAEQDRYADEYAVDLATQMASDECVDELLAIMESATADDPELELVRMGLEDGMAPAEIAEVSSIPTKRVYSLSQKFRRRVAREMEQHECWEDHRYFGRRSN